jgi:hypothetical protein
MDSAPCNSFQISAVFCPSSLLPIPSHSPGLTHEEQDRPYHNKHAQRILTGLLKAICRFLRRKTVPCVNCKLRDHLVNG